MNAHTPGPWAIHRGRTTVSVKTTDGETVSSWYTGHHEMETETHHNARLIAAAPDMLEALHKAADTFRDLRMVFGISGKMMAVEACQVAEDATRAVIAKATGEQP